MILQFSLNKSIGNVLLYCVYVSIVCVCKSHLCTCALRACVSVCVCMVARRRSVDSWLLRWKRGDGGNRGEHRIKKQFYFFAFTARVVFDRPLDRAEELCTLHSLLYVCALHKKSERKREKKVRKGKRENLTLALSTLGLV